MSSARRNWARGKATRAVRAQCGKSLCTLEKTFNVEHIFPLSCSFPSQEFFFSASFSSCFFTSFFAPSIVCRTTTTTTNVCIQVHRERSRTKTTSEEEIHVRIYTIFFLWKWKFYVVAAGNVKCSPVLAFGSRPSLWNRHGAELGFVMCLLSLSLFLIIKLWSTHKFFYGIIQQRTHWVRAQLLTVDWLHRRGRMFGLFYGDSVMPLPAIIAVILPPPRAMDNVDIDIVVQLWSRRQLGGREQQNGRRGMLCTLKICDKALARARRHTYENYRYFSLRARDQWAAKTSTDIRRNAQK